MCILLLLTPVVLFSVLHAAPATRHRVYVYTRTFKCCTDAGASEGLGGGGEGVSEGVEGTKQGGLQVSGGGGGSEGACVCVCVLVWHMQRYRSTVMFRLPSFTVHQLYIRQLLQ